MFRQESDHEDLKIEIYNLKKQNYNLMSENNILKVKLRKIQEECSRKDKQIVNLLDPQKNLHFRKVISEKGAHILLNLKQQNLRFEKALQEKDDTIKRLQKKLEVINSYFEPKRTFFQSNANTEVNLNNKLEVKVPQVSGEHAEIKSSKPQENVCDNQESYMSHENDKSYKNDKPRTPDFSIISSTMLEQVKELQKGNSLSERCETRGYSKDSFSRSPIDNLVTIMECLKTDDRMSSNSPMSDLDRTELFCETPHEEILQVQKYLNTMLGEVDQLKLTIAKLQEDQEKTEAILKTKDSSIKKLANEIKGLKKRKPYTATNNSRINRTNGVHSKSFPMDSSRKMLNIKSGSLKQSKISLSKCSLYNTTSEDERSECPFYENYLKQNKAVKSKARKEGQCEVKRLWIRNQPAEIEAESCMFIQMPKIDETTTPRSIESTEAGINSCNSNI